MILPRLLAIALILSAVPATRAGATVLCGQKVRATGQLREGSSLRLRGVCRANEVVVDPALFGAGGGGSDTISFTSESVIFGTATLYLTPDGHISTDEHDARTPIGGGTLRSLRCYVSEAAGGGGLDVTLGVGACGAALSYAGKPTLAFLPADSQIEKDSGSATASVSNGQCVALRVNMLATTTPTYLNCTVERLPG